MVNEYFTMIIALIDLPQILIIAPPKLKFDPNE